jgi:hypothetical protein
MNVNANFNSSRSLITSTLKKLKPWGIILLMVCCDAMSEVEDKVLSVAGSSAMLGPVF